MNNFTCNQFRDLIFDYIDNELNTDDKLKIEGHMENCSECKNEYEKAKNLIEAIKDSRFATDNCLYTALVPQLKQMKKHSILNKIRMYGSVAAAAVITIVMLIYVMPMMNPKIADNSSAFDAEMFEMQAEEENAVIEETVQATQNEVSGKIMQSRSMAYTENNDEIIMENYLNTYAPEYVDETEVLYVSYGEVELPEEIVTDKVVSDIKYSIYVIDRFSNISFDVGEVTEYSNVYYANNNNLRYLVILKFNNE